MTYADVLRMGEQQLAEADVQENVLNSWYLFSYCFGMRRDRYFLRQEEEAEPSLVERYRKLLEKRAARIPLEQITGETEFMGLPFYLDENVLIPRQDTECLVEEVLPHCRGKNVLDLCTGSGCIGISLAVLGGCSHVTMTDLSEKALLVARKNAERNQAERYAGITLVHSDLFKALHGSFDIIVSNPPYIPTLDIAKLMPEVRDHEPRMALDGSEDGLLFYRRILSGCHAFLHTGGALFFEIGYDQGEAVRTLMEQTGFSHVEIKKDLAGLDRVVKGRY